MKVLITSSRLPFALGMVRQLAAAGHDSTLSVAHFGGQSEREHRKLFIAMAGDMSWDGEPISGMSKADRALLEALEDGG